MTERPEQDLELLERWQDGDTVAAGELLDRHFATLHRFFSNKAGKVVEDLVQETLLQCVRSHHRFGQRSSFKTFLLGVARNVLLQHYRAAGRHHAPEGFERLSVHELQESPSALLGRKRDHQLLLDALRRLPLNDQIVLELQYWEDLSSQEIAEVMHCPSNTVRVRQGRARRKLVALLEELGAAASTVTQSPADFDAWRRQVRDAAFGSG
jgi:RNA polymerase sigma-70 factor (ECF subfamily)